MMADGVFPSGIRFEDAGADGVAYSDVRMYEAQQEIVVVWNSGQVGRSFDFYAVASPSWENIRTSDLAGANVGYIYNLALASDGTAWALTYNDEATLADNGVFQCPDISASPVVWTLIYSLAQYRADGYSGFPRALSADDNNNFYIQSYANDDYGYGKMTVTWVAPGAVPGGRECMNSQHSVGQFVGVAGVRGGHSPDPTPGKVIITMDEAASTLVLYSTIVPDPVGVCGNHAIVSGGGDTGSLIHYTDSAVLNGSVITTLYGDADWRTGVVSDGTNVITVRFTDKDLMRGATSLATSADAFGAGRSGAGFCFGLDGYGEIIWVAQDAAVTTRFISRRTTAGVWQDKTGNWAAAIGVWPGSVGDITPTPLTCETNTTGGVGVFFRGARMADG